MPSVFSVIGASWEFYRKQPVLNSVLAWLLITPLTLHGILLTPEGDKGTTILGDALAENLAMSDTAITFLTGILTLAFSIWVLWGQASVMVVAKRLLQSKAGRSRSSFSTVRSESSAVIIPLFLTELLRGCATLLLTVPALLVLTMANTFGSSDSALQLVSLFLFLCLLIPPAFFQLRTYFYDLLIVTEGTAYRGALKQSNAMILGKSWQCLGKLTGLYALLLLPAIAVGAATDEAIATFAPSLFPVSQIIGSTLLAFAILFITLSSVGLFGALKKT